MTTPRRPRRRALLRGLSLVLVFIPGGAVTAQVRGAPVGGAGLQRMAGGGTVQVTAPRGDFADNVGAGFGVGGHLVWRLEPSGVVNLRSELGLLTYGQNLRRVPMANTGGLVRLDLRTSNNVLTVLTGPQLGGPVGAFTPYFAALGGFSVFWTESTIEGSRNVAAFASTTNLADAVLAYGGSGGASWRVKGGRHPVRVDLNVRYLRHDDVRYLTDARVDQAFLANRDPVPVRGRADMLTYSLGFTAHLF